MTGVYRRPFHNALRPRPGRWVGTAASAAPAPASLVASRRTTYRRPVLARLRNQARWVGTKADVTPPVTLYVSETKTKVSQVATYDTTVVSWSADENCQAWQIRQVALAGDTHNDGTLLASGGAVTAGAGQTTNITGSVLVGGDGSKLLKIFAQDLAGNWTT